jgi:hypothetical protein
MGKNENDNNNQYKYNTMLKIFVKSRGNNNVPPLNYREARAKAGAGPA